MNLPPGWRRQEIVRKTGLNVGKVDIYITSPGGKSFRSKKSLQMYINENKLPYDINCFNFTTKNNKTSNYRSLSTLDSSLSLTQSSECTEILDCKAIEDTVAALTNGSETECSYAQKLNSVNTTMTQTESCSPLITTCAELLSKNWITDQTLQIYLDILSTNIIKPCYKTMIFNPTIVYGIKVLDDYSHLLNPADFKNNDFFIMPINDANLLNGFEGSHWSVLFFDKGADTYYHYDSLNNHNIKHANMVIQKIAPYLNTGGQTPKVLTISCPKQINNYDCGVYSIMAIEKTICCIKKGQGIPTTLMSMQFDEADLIRKRSCLSYIINNRLTLGEETILSVMYNSNEPAMKNQPEKLEKTTQCNLWSTVVGKNRLKTPEGNELAFKISCSNRYSALSGVKPTNEGVEAQNKTTNDKVKVKERSRNIQGQTKQIKEKGITTNCDSEIEVQIYSDSQGRHISKSIRKYSNKKVKATGWVIPNATTKQVFSHALKSNKGTVVIISGTIDLLEKNTKEIYSDLEDNLKIMSKTKHILLTTVPKLFDTAGKIQEHDERIKLNSYIEELAARIDNVHIIDLEQLRGVHFSEDGIHLNHRGKTKLTYMILEKLNTIQSLTPYVPKLVPSAHKLSMKDFPPLALPRSVMTSPGNGLIPNKTFPPKLVPVTSKIHIINADMSDIISEFSKDKGVAFAHCISADFDSDKQMSQGVAVCFREAFGKPKKCDLCHEHLAAQQKENGAVVYSLVTKPKFFKKPDPNIYDAAFFQLTKQFKEKQLRTLICSPMGCVRDRISPAHFAAQLVCFQRRTGADIKIITQDEQSKSGLRKGLAFDAFIDVLTQSIKVEADRVVQCHSKQDNNTQTSSLEHYYQSNTTPTCRTSHVAAGSSVIEEVTGTSCMTETPEVETTARVIGLSAEVVTPGSALLQEVVPGIECFSEMSQCFSITSEVYNSEHEGGDKSRDYVNNQVAEGNTLNSHIAEVTNPS